MCRVSMHHRGLFNLSTRAAQSPILPIGRLIYQLKHEIVYVFFFFSTELHGLPVLPGHMLSSRLARHMSLQQSNAEPPVEAVAVSVSVAKCSRVGIFVYVCACNKVHLASESSSGAPGASVAHAPYPTPPQPPPPPPPPCCCCPSLQ